MSSASLPEPICSSAAGRPMHEHWLGFKKVYSNGKVAAKCSTCSKTFLNTAKARMSRHRKRCGTLSVEDGIDENMSDSSDAEGEVHSVNDDSNFNDNSAVSVSPLSSTSTSGIFTSTPSPESRISEFKRKQVKIRSFLDNVSATEGAKIDMHLAKFFYGCNVPFAACDSKYFKRFVNALRPAYSPPNRKKLATTLLDKTHQNILKSNSELVVKMEKQSTLLIDGWKNSSANKHYIVTMLASSNDEKVFLEAFDISALRETSETLVDIVDQSVALAKERYDTDVYACVSDNAHNMTCMGANLNNMLFTTCNAHTANLLAGDILKTPKYSKIMSRVMTVQKEFRNCGLETRLLAAGGTKAVLSCSTRWTSQRGAGVSFLRNLSAMKKVAADCDHDAESDSQATRPDTGVSQLLFKADFIESVKQLMDMLEPVANLTNECQKSDYSSADAVQKWLEVIENGSEELSGFVKWRCNKSNVFNEVSMTANFFHPEYRGHKLSTAQIQKVNDYIFESESLDAAALESCRLYIANEGTFGALSRKKITSTKTYWHYASQQGHKPLASFAMKFLKIPSSTAQLERLFSNWAYIHNDIRNRLSLETSKKLVDIYFTLRSKDDPEPIDDCEEKENK